MRTITLFNFISLNGYFKAENEDISWHRHNADGEQYSRESVKKDGILLFGRKTYEMMASFWPTEMAKEQMPEVAEGMNRRQKIVFSNTLQKADWENTTVINGDIVSQIKKMKQQPGPDMAILGSGTIATQFAQAGLIDRYEFMIDPLILNNKGISIFGDITQNVALKLVGSRIFDSGMVLLVYQPA